LGWFFLVVVLALTGCIEKRRNSGKDGAAKGKASAAAAVAAPATRDQVDDSLANLIEGERVRAEYAATDPWKGAAEPLVTIIEFSDFECPFCSKLASTLEQAAARLPARDARAGRAGRACGRGRARAGQVLGDARQALRGSHEALRR
jgi:protein-disulfide isomerase